MTEKPSTKTEKPVEKAVVVRDNKAVESADNFIKQAIEMKLPIETLKELLVMRKELKADAARDAFVVAMSGFQGECPVIDKNKKIMNTGGKTVRSTYADLGHIAEVINPILARYGLSYGFSSTFDKESITVTCKATHELGHSESSSFKLAIGSESGMTSSQLYGARVTFARRYALCDVLGIVTGDEDTDDEGGEDDAPPQKFTQADVDALVKKIEVAETVKDLSDLYMNAGDLKVVKAVVDAKDKRKVELLKAAEPKV